MLCKFFIYIKFLPHEKALACFVPLVASISQIWIGEKKKKERIQPTNFLLFRAKRNKKIFSTYILKLNSIIFVTKIRDLIIFYNLNFNNKVWFLLIMQIAPFLIMKIQSIIYLKGHFINL